ncbi:MAG TPA: hypothetical protein VG817_11340 [Gemmatimonadales bacterium]|nr:hypothetical protein [Gemmatimonadales bacterium]
MTGPRDWDKELADIDKVIARGGGTAPASGNAPVARGSSGSGALPAATGGRFAVATTWFRVILGLLLAVGITQWPYANACGLNLAMYLGAIATVIVAGLWSAVSSWNRRLGFAHFLSLGVLLWGLVLAAREVLPRTGYARELRTWSCPTVPSTAGGVEAS